MIKSNDELLWLGLLIGVVLWLVFIGIVLFYWVANKIKNRKPLYQQVAELAQKMPGVYEPIVHPHESIKRVKLCEVPPLPLHMHGVQKYGEIDVNLSAITPEIRGIDIPGSIRKLTPDQLDVMAYKYVKAMSLPPVPGDLLPPIGATVQIHLASRDEWVDHEVVGYYVWPAHNNDDYFRVSIRVKDANGTLNARLLQDIKWVKS